MALQGTLDTFELPDVLRLLASTCKSGRLHVRSDRGEGEVWLIDGQVVGVEAGGLTEVAGALFDLLRAHEGSFAFEPGAAAPAPGHPLDVEPLLADAETALVEWRDIEAVVPSLGAWVCLATELPGPELTIDATTWRLVATIGSGLTVGELGRVLDLGEVEVSRLVRDVVQLGIGEVVAAPPAPVEEPAWTAPVYERTVPAYEPPVEEAVESPAPMPAFEEPVSYADLAPVVPPPVPEPMPSFDGPVDDPGLPADLYAPAPDPAEADEIARQLAMLSPRAAEAVAAAATAGSDAERHAALDAVDDDGEPVNRGLLLKFLSSVKS
jgi:hypothetical protein